jgi:hypothetical protein
MTLHTVRSAREGAWLGAVAGMMFAIVQLLVAVVAWGQPAIVPLRAWSSVLAGRAAFGPHQAGAAALIGLPLHLLLATGFGFLYGLFNGGATAATRRAWARQAAQGALYGLVLWLVNFQIVGRVALPWMLDLPQRTELMMHMLCYGVPLGLMYAATTRRTRLLIAVPRAA